MNIFFFCYFDPSKWGGFGMILDLVRLPLLVFNQIETFW